MKGPDTTQLQRLINPSRVLEIMDPHSVESGKPVPKTEKLKTAVGMKGCLRTNALTLLLLLSVVAGVGLGAILRTREEKWTKREVMYINFPGDLFLRMLKCLILPLISSSLISAIGGLDLRMSRKIGLRAIVYYMCTTILAVILGIVLVVSIHPGTNKAGDTQTEGTTRKITVADTMLDLLRNLFPPNIVEACVSQYRTLLLDPGLQQTFLNITNETQAEYPNASLVIDSNDNITKLNVSRELPVNEWKMKGENADGTNILGVVMFSIVFSIAISHLSPKSKPLMDFFVALSDVMMALTHWVIWLSPIGILFLVCSKIIEIDDFNELIGQLGMYLLTVLVGIFIHGFIFLPLIFTIVTRKLPFRFIYNMMPALTTAWGTSSSSAALPVTISCLEEKNHIDPQISRFVIPIGATINMDGTALYEAVAAIFIAQLREVPMDIGKIIAISITATAASIGAAGIPQAGLITMVMVLNVVGLPAEDVTLIVVVDWLVDRFRTMINVLGDSLGAGIVSELSKKDLEQMNQLDTSFETTKSDCNGTLTSNGSAVSQQEETVENQVTSM